MTYPAPAISCALATPATLLFRLLLAGGLLVGLALPVVAQDDTPMAKDVSFINTDGADIGTATLSATQIGLMIELDLQDLPPETWHGFHIHENAACDAEDGFQSAGGHFSVSDTSHGFLVEGGPHSGDMPNQYVSADGTLKAQVLNTFAFIGGDLDNVTGRALVIHGGPDDYESQPSGAAGDRIACAVIE